jgi:hypothetical protein
MFQISTKSACFAVILVSAFNSGCISFPPVYGETWAEPVRLEADACPAIDGVYQNAGERFSQGTYQRQAISLAYLLGSHAQQRDDESLGYTFENPAEDAYQTVSLKLTEEKLHVVASRADGSSRTFDLPTREGCRDSAVLLKAAWDNGTALVASMTSRNTLALGRAEDGSLLVREGSSGVAFVMWVPILAGSDTTWTMFPPVAPASAQLSGLTP